jgi:hypothetical protein
MVGNAEALAVELVSSATDDVRTLVTELDQLLSAEYPPEQRHGLRLEAIFEPNIRFLLRAVERCTGGMRWGGIVRGLRRSEAHVPS